LEVDGAEKLNQKWCDTIIEPMYKGLVGRYPFVKKSREHASMKEVKFFLHPKDGVVARFRESELSAYLAKDGDPGAVTAQPLGADAPLQLSARVVDFLDRAHKLGLLLFPDGGEMAIDFELRVSCSGGVNKIVLKVDEIEYEYLCATDSTKSVHWPEESDPHAASLKVYGQNINDEWSEGHDFGLFKMLEKNGRARQKGSGEVSIVMDLSKRRLGKLKLGVRPTTRSHGASIFYGFGGKTFLAPFRRSSLKKPPMSLYRGRPFSCGQRAQSDALVGVSGEEGAAP
jgi:type VI protein secretion system component VasK